MNDNNPAYPLDRRTTPEGVGSKLPDVRPDTGLLHNVGFREIQNYFLEPVGLSSMVCCLALRSGKISFCGLPKYSTMHSTTRIIA